MMNQHYQNQQNNLEYNLSLLFTLFLSRPLLLSSYHHPLYLLAPLRLRSQSGTIQIFSHITQQFMTFFLNINSLIFSDGEPTGPETWSGLIGDAIGGKNGLIRMSMNPRFKKVPGLVNFEDVHKSLLQNNDISNLFHLCLLIQEGPKSKHIKIFNCEPGKVTQARWITTANNILVHYMQSFSPSNELRLLVRIVVNLYAPSIFQIKKDFHVSNGPRHLFNLFSLAKDLFKANAYFKYLDVVKTTLQTNGFHIHIENMLITMSLDNDAKIKNKAIDIIKKRREMGETEDIKARRIVQYTAEWKKIGKKGPISHIRKFRVPEINWNARAYHELIDIDEVDEMDYSSPALLANFSIDQIKKNEFDDDFWRIPCHSQAVERAVYLTSQAAETVVGYEARHGFILNKIQSAERIPTNFSSKHFRNLDNESPSKG